MATRRRTRAAEADELRTLIQSLIRACGVLSTSETPCGQPLGISHAHALMYLHGAEDEGRAPTQQELGTALSIDKSNVTRLCRRMEELGHLEQCRCDEDGRARRLHLTRSGAKVAKDVLTSSRARFAAIMEHVPSASRAGLIDALGVLVTAIEQVAPAPVERERARARAQKEAS